MVVLLPDTIVAISFMLEVLRSVSSSAFTSLIRFWLSAVLGFTTKSITFTLRVSIGVKKFALNSS